MSGDLLDEIEAINSIYSPDSIVKVSGNEEIYTLVLPTHPVTLRLSFPSGYPTEPLLIPGVQSVGDSKPKGYGSHVLELAREVLNRIFTPGQVCVFDLVEELEKCLQTEEGFGVEDNDQSTVEILGTTHEQSNDLPPSLLRSNTFHPSEWIHSNQVSLKKSSFIAHAITITHPSQLPALLDSLHATSKNISKATHNLSAYRIRCPSDPLSIKKDSGNSELGVTESGTQATAYQDCDDDGETAAGGRLLHLMQVMDVWNVLVVVSRWYGGVNLGPDRFRIISNVAREILVSGGWAKKREGKKDGG